MTRPQVIAVALVASLALHIALLLVPGLRLRLPIHRETLVEVEVAPPDAALRPAPEPEPELPPPPPEPATTPPTPPARTAPAPLARDAAVMLEQALAPLVPATARPAAAPPPLQLPRRALELPGADTIAWTPPTPRSSALPPLDSTFRPASTLPAGPDQQQGQLLAEALLRELAAPPEQPVQPLVPPPQLEIEGPVGKERKVVTQPPPPSVAIRHSAAVHLKFYVSPRGEVVRAEPITRGDADLDRAALAYIKQFRFNALPHGDQREQWGTIRLRFRLE